MNQFPSLIFDIPYFFNLAPWYILSKWIHSKPYKQRLRNISTMKPHRHRSTMWHFTCMVSSTLCCLHKTFSVFLFCLWASCSYQLLNLPAVFPTQIRLKKNVTVWSCHSPFVALSIDSKVEQLWLPFTMGIYRWRGMSKVQLTTFKMLFKRVLIASIKYIISSPLINMTTTDRQNE